MVVIWKCRIVFIHAKSASTILVQLIIARLPDWDDYQGSGSITELRQRYQSHTAVLTTPALARRILPSYFVILIEWMSKKIGLASQGFARPLLR